MGARRRVKQGLRRFVQQGTAIWDSVAAPLRCRGDLERLAAINALQRVEETRMPKAFDRGGVRLVLFSHYHPQGWLQRCIRRELADLRSRGWQVLLLSDRLDEAALGWCDSQDIGWMRRRNEGRDFGAFQDGCLVLEQWGLTAAVERLILLNDSVYPVVELEASSWPQFLAHQGPEVLGFSDSFQNGYHLQSYGLHLPGSVLQRPWWQNYWRTYRGWIGMTGAIRDGEIGLSQLLLHQGQPLKALHPVSRLRGQIASAALLEQLQQHCSESAALWIQQKLLVTGMSSLHFYSPAHYWAIPLLLDGCPFLKRWLLESNENQMLDPLLVAGGSVALVDPEELVDYLRPPVIGFAR